MRYLISLLFILLVQGSLLGQKFDKLTTTDGKTYTDVTVKEVQPDGIRIFHSDGATKISFDRLPEDIRAQFNFDANDAEKFQNEQAKKRQNAAVVAGQKQKRENRFSQWTQELARKKESALYGPTDLYQHGSSTAEVNKFKKKAGNIISVFETRLNTLRVLIAQIDGAGGSFADTQRLIDAVYNEKVFVGMPQEFVILSWGKPSDINSTINEHGSSEQWIYKHGSVDAQYIYIDEGRVSTMQN